MAFGFEVTSCCKAFQFVDKSKYSRTDEIDMLKHINNNHRYMTHIYIPCKSNKMTQLKSKRYESETTATSPSDVCTIDGNCILMSTTIPNQ